MWSDRLLICTDLDGTLIPDGPEPQSYAAREHFSTLASHPRVELAYVSGRHSELIEQAIAINHLPVPDFVIGDVGTTIYHVGNDHDWKYQAHWEEIIGNDWGNSSHADLAAILSDLRTLQMQEPARQNKFKLSFYISPHVDRSVLEDAIIHHLDAHGVQARLIWSVDRPAGTGLLDIVPQRASKLHAIEELMQQQGYGFRNTVFCGDSGNDLEVLVSPLQAVVVANALQEIKDRARELADKSGNSAQLYVARGGFMGMNGNYSAGILEGIAHYYPRAIEWMGFPQALQSRCAF